MTASPASSATARGLEALEELRGVLEATDGAALERFVDALAGARRVVAHGVGREGLMMRALAMRLYHLGLDAHVLGDMTAPPVGESDLLVVSAGPGHFATVAALVDVARAAGARIACVTATADGDVPARADTVLVLPAQTMRDDRGATRSVLPMGSLYEGAMYLAFELVVLRLGERTGTGAEAMRARHTNLE